MEKIDRLGWAVGISFVSFGARIGVRVNHADALERLTAHLPPGWRPARSPVVDELYSLRVSDDTGRAGLRHFHLLYGGSALLARSLDLNEVLEHLESALHFNVAASARRGLFVHAGAVGWRGRAIVLPGRSMSGKTSLVAALVRAGATYYSDEYAVFDERGRLRPYPARLSIRQENGSTVERCSAEELGGRVGGRPLPVGAVAVGRWKLGARWRPRRLSPGQAMLALLDNTVLAQLRPQLALDTLQRVVSEPVALKTNWNDAEEMAASLLQYMPTTTTGTTERTAVTQAAE